MCCFAVHSVILDFSFNQTWSAEGYTVEIYHDHSWNCLYRLSRSWLCLSWRVLQVQSLLIFCLRMLLRHCLVYYLVPVTWSSLWKNYFRNLCWRNFASPMIIFVFETVALFILDARELRIKLENDLLQLRITIMAEASIFTCF